MREKEGGRGIYGRSTLDPKHAAPNLPHVAILIPVGIWSAEEVGLKRSRRPRCSRRNQRCRSQRSGWMRPQARDTPGRRTPESKYSACRCNGIPVGTWVSWLAMHESSAHMRAPAERVRNARGSALQRSVRHSRAALASPAPAPLQRAALTLALRDPPLPPPRDPAVGGRIPLSASPGGLRDGRGALRHARTQALGTPDLAMGLRCTKDQHPSRESQSQPVRTTCALEGALRAERMRRAARPHTAWTCSDACVRHAPSRAEALAAVARFLHLPVHRTALGLRPSVMRGRGQHSRVEACEPSLLLQRKI